MKAFEYHVGDNGLVRTPDPRSPTGMARLDVISSGPHGMVIDERARDVLRIARAAFAVDRLSPRRDRSDNQSYELSWQRRLRVTVEVHDPSLWMSLEPLLCGALGFLTDDNWSFSFRDIARRCAVQI